MYARASMCVCKLAGALARTCVCISLSNYCTMEHMSAYTYFLMCGRADRHGHSTAVGMQATALGHTQSFRSHA